jgi:magnesium chelatase accessory protein
MEAAAPPLSFRRFFMSDRLQWTREGRDWPNRETSRFIRAGGLEWHVQVMGNGPVLLLIHGTGASTHSWRALAPRLAQHFTVVAPDLPGHGFTGLPSTGGLSLPSMARTLSELLHVLDVAPRLAIGHSAGAAIAIRMVLDHEIAPEGLVSLNGALLPFTGLARHVFSPLAKLLVSIPFVPSMFAEAASHSRAIARQMGKTGSTLDAQGLDLYGRLLSNPTHVANTLGMMASWDLDSVSRELQRIMVPVLLITGSRDLTVPPEQAFKVRDLLPRAKVENLRGLGHLAHEEQPLKVAELILRFYRAIDAAERASPDRRPERL